MGHPTSSHPGSGVLKEDVQVRQMCTARCCACALRHLPYLVVCRCRAWAAYPKQPVSGWELLKTVYEKACQQKKGLHRCQANCSLTVRPLSRSRIFGSVQFVFSGRERWSSLAETFGLMRLAPHHRWIHCIYTYYFQSFPWSPLIGLSVAEKLFIIRLLSSHRFLLLPRLYGGAWQHERYKVEED